MTVPIIRPEYSGNTHTYSHTHTNGTHMNKQSKCCHDNKGMASHTAQEGVCLLALTENQNQIVSLKDVYIYMYNVESETTTNVLSKTKYD